MGVPACTLRLIGLPTSESRLNVIACSLGQKGRGLGRVENASSISCDDSLGKVDRQRLQSILRSEPLQVRLSNQ